MSRSSKMHDTFYSVLFSGLISFHKKDQKHFIDFIWFLTQFEDLIISPDKY